MCNNHNVRLPNFVNDITRLFENFKIFVLNTLIHAKAVVSATNVILRRALSCEFQCFKYLLQIKKKKGEKIYQANSGIYQVTIFVR